MRLHSMDFPDNQWEQIQQEAKRQGIAAAYLIRRVMDVYIDRQSSQIIAPRSGEKSEPMRRAKSAK
jgi:hypothetical protein